MDRYALCLHSGSFGAGAWRDFDVGSQVNLQTETVDKCQADEPLCIGPSVYVHEAMRQMKERNAAAVLICRDQALLGIFTERDALKLMAAGGDFDVPIERVMSPNPVVVKAHDTVGSAIAAMTRGGYRRLIMVDDHGRPTGMLKVEHILHYLAEHFPTVIYNLPPQPHHSLQQREGA
jgi:predicted transcriptional regulator